MKRIIGAFALLFGAQAFAVTADSNWDEIKRDYSVLEQPQKISFTAGEATTFVNIFNVCWRSENKTVETIKALPVYEHVNLGHDRDELKVVGHAVLSRPIHYIAEIGGDEKGRAPVRLRASIARTYDVPVYKNHSNREQLLFTKSYTLPECN